MSIDTSLPPRSRQGASGAAKPNKGKPPRKKRPLLRIFILLVIVVILALGGYAAYLYSKVNGAINHGSSGTTQQSVPSAERAQVKPIAILLLGMDYRPATKSMNTDVMMVAAFNPQSQTATIVSIPRDSDLELQGYKRQKVNQFYSGFHREARTDPNLSGDAADAYARDKTREMLEKFFGIKIDYTAVINFQGFVDVIDKLGGVNVYVDQDMRYVDNADGTNIDLKKGQQTLKGEDALGFVRYRKSNRGTAASSDFARNDRQSRVLGAIVDRMKSLGGVLKLGGVIDAAGNSMVSDIPKDQITNIMKTYYNIDRQHIHFMPLEGVWKSPYVYLDDVKLNEAKQALAEELSVNGRSVQAAASPIASGQ